MKIYHGSSDRNIEKFELKNKNARANLDFGKGVYFTSKFEQAKTWSCRRGETGAVYECDIDLSALNLLQYDDSDNEDLLYILCLCRTGLEDIASEVTEGFDNADIIEGLMLDGTVKDFSETAEQFIEGDLTFQELKEKTKVFGEERDQFCLKTKKALAILNSGLIKIYFTEKSKGTTEVVVTQTKDLQCKRGKMKSINKHK